jgi:hypothetical protein
MCATSYCEACEQKGLPVSIATTTHRHTHNLLKMVPPPIRASAERADCAGSFPPTADSCATCVLPPTRRKFVDITQYGVTLDTLKDMLRREEVLRLCEETQLRLLLQGEDSYVPVVVELQKQVSREFGVEEELGMMLMRCAESFARSDAELEEIVSLSLYRRHNRCVDGNLHVGHTAPELAHPVHLFDTTLSSVPLFEHLNKLASAGSGGIFRNPLAEKVMKPIVLFAGSWS